MLLAICSHSFADVGVLKYVSFSASHIPSQVVFMTLHTVLRPILKLKACDSCESPVAKYLRVITNLSAEERGFLLGHFSS